MNISHIIRKEVAFKKFGFLTGILSLAMATAVFVGASIILKGDELSSEQVFMEKERQLGEEMLRLENDYRIIMRKMGYNVLIINENQSISELEKNGYPSTFLDFGDVWKIAESDITSLNHLLPVLQQKVYWEEKGMEIILSGTRGQVPVYSKPSHLTGDKEYRSPIMERVPEGKADIGAEIAATLQIKPGEVITIKGNKFEVNRIYPRKGTRDDLNVWISLDKAQSILNMPGKISGILALQCICAIDELGKVKKDVESVLPHTRVFEYSSMIATRADIRKRASRLNKELMETERIHQGEMREKKESLAMILILGLIASASVWIFVLILNNVRDRQHEVGILLAIGFSRMKVLQIFLGKSVLMGLIAGLIGCLIGLLVGYVWSGSALPGELQGELVSLWVLVVGFLLAPLLALAAGLPPSILAAGQDPADIIGRE
jgi:putative ABC transport system permease protein